MQNHCSTSNNDTIHSYPFGMGIPTRSWSVSGENYRFGFNGKENDDQTYGDNNELDYGFRIYDPRIGRFCSIDPLSKKYAFYTPYQFSGNKPIACIDLDGREDSAIITVEYWNRNTLIKTVTVREKLDVEGPLGNGNKFERLQFFQDENNSVELDITGEYAEQDPDTKQYNYRFQSLWNTTLKTNTEQAFSLWKSIVKPSDKNIKYMGAIEEWAFAHIDQEELLRLAVIFSEGQGFLTEDKGFPGGDDQRYPRGKYDQTSVKKFKGDTVITYHDANGDGKVDTMVSQVGKGNSRDGYPTHDIRKAKKDDLKKYPTSHKGE